VSWAREGDRAEGAVDGSDAAGAKPALSGLHVKLTAEEIRALPFDNVRLHMAHYQGTHADAPKSRARMGRP